MEDHRSKSLIVQDVSLCGFVRKYFIFVYGRIEWSLKDALLSGGQRRKYKARNPRGCYTVVIYETQPTYLSKSMNWVTRTHLTHLFCSTFEKILEDIFLIISLNFVVCNGK